ncbi:hypothetical protein VNO77_03142 [Canavalia gladiata]|uniref:Uncharacterized protein n=1 Tax=Canavalia gladiata TaxID=3824 RepID=A0AAN9MW86_CANGL
MLNIIIKLQRILDPRKASERYWDVFVVKILELIETGKLLSTVAITLSSHLSMARYAIKGDYLLPTQVGSGQEEVSKSALVSQEASTADSSSETLVQSSARDVSDIVNALVVVNALVAVGQRCMDSRMRVDPREVHENMAGVASVPETCNSFTQLGHIDRPRLLPINRIMLTHAKIQTAASNL